MDDPSTPIHAPLASSPMLDSAPMAVQQPSSQEAAAPQPTKEPLWLINVDAAFKVGCLVALLLILWYLARLVFFQALSEGEIYFLTMTLCGSVGGVTSFLLVKNTDTDTGMHFRDNKSFYLLVTAVFCGNIASFSVPLLLNFIQLENVISTQVPQIFVFIGVCLIASTFSARIIGSISSRIIKLNEQSTININNDKQG